MDVQSYVSTRIMSASLRDSSTNVTVLDDSTKSITSDSIDSKSADSTREHCELMPLEKMKSCIWKHFAVQDGGFKEKDKKKQTTVIASYA